jgi:hypothetical protein
VHLFDLPCKLAQIRSAAEFVHPTGYERREQHHVRSRVRFDGSLPRLKEQPGVKEILHGASLDGTDVTTVIAWRLPMTRSATARAILSANQMALEAELGVASTGEGFWGTQHLG